jgi:exosortase
MECGRKGKDAVTNPLATLRPRHLVPFAPLAVVVGILTWVFWPTFGELLHEWHANAQYSHGFLVPFFAAFLLYYRRDKLDVSAMKPSLWGLAVLGLGLGFRLWGAYFGYVSWGSISLIPTVMGLILTFGGWAAFRWAWPGALFLSFMIPLPYNTSLALAGPLQRLATIASTFVMQVLGLPAIAEGNVIYLNDHTIGIVEACSGLSMLMVFFALSTAVVLVIQRHWIDRTIILLSAIPVALISNIIRVTITGILYNVGAGEMANYFFHEVAGWIMMPLALGMMWVELKVLQNLFIDVPVTARPTAVPAARSRKAVQARPAAPRPAAPRPAANRRPNPAPPRSRRQGETPATPREETPVEQGKQS